MSDYALFLSYSSADLAAVEELEVWLQAPPRNLSAWRDRRAIQPGAPDYYPPIQAGISASANFVLLLSPRWLRSKVAADELADAQAAGKKIIVVVHPDIPRDPTTPKGRAHKNELVQELQSSRAGQILERPNWIWLNSTGSFQHDYTPVEEALMTDFTWKSRHAIIDQRHRQWKDTKDDAALLRGAQLAELMAEALRDDKQRKPVLTGEQRAFLFASQRHDKLERDQLESLYWGAQARAAAFAARDRGEAEPDLALLLAAEAASVATVPETRSSLLALLHRHAPLTKTLHGHGAARQVSGLAFSPDGQWVASVDRDIAANDDRQANLLIYNARSGTLARQLQGGTRLTAAAWGQRWLAVASAGSIGWIRWDEWKEKFLGNTPTALDGNVAPDFLAFSPPALQLDDGEVLAWGTQWGDFGLIRTSDVRLVCQRRLSGDSSGAALEGVSWLNDGRLIMAESGRILVRPFPDLEPFREIAAPGRILSLDCDGEYWLAACVGKDGLGLLMGRGDHVWGFLPGRSPRRRYIAKWAGQPEDRWILAGSTNPVPGEPAVLLRNTKRDIQEVPEILLQGEGTAITSFASDPTGRIVAAGQMGGQVWLWDRFRRSHLVSAFRSGLSARAIAASTGDRTAIVTEDGRILLLGSDFSGDPIFERTLPFLPSRVLFVDKGRTLLLVPEHGELTAIDTAGSLRTLAWEGAPAKPWAMVGAADQPVIAVRSSGSSFKVLRIAEQGLVLLREIDSGGRAVALAVDPLAKRVYALVHRPFLELVSWRLDAPDEAPVRVASVSSDWPMPPLACPSGELVAAGARSHLLFVPTEPPGEPNWRMGHSEPVKLIAAGGGLVASLACCFEDTHADEVRLWTGDGQPLGPVTLPEHAADIAIAPDGHALIALGLSGKLWHVTLSVEDWMRIARSVAGRDLTNEEQRLYGIDAWRARASGAAG